MFTKINKITKKKLQVNHAYSIPKNIQNNINKKWFYLYNWIWEQDVRQSIERDFLKLIKKFWTFFSFILIIPSIIILFIWTTSIFNLYFFWVLWFINIFLFFYLIIIGVKRSNILRKNSQVLITNIAISINWNINQINKSNKFFYNSELKKIWYQFEEDLFQESNINKSKKQILNQIKKQTINWYNKILKMFGWSKNSFKLIISLWFLYSVYLLSLWFIYFFWIFFIWIFWNILTYINKQILLITWHEITTINNHFENIDKYSVRLIKEKEILSNLLSKAKKNDWKDSLLTKINSWIKNINNNASNAINTSIELKWTIEKSQYKKMFNFNIYNSWIKKQILTPLEQIKDLLNTNLLKLEETLKQITIQIKETTNSSLSWPLTANKLRIEKKIVDIKKHMKAMDIYINKLR